MSKFYAIADSFPEILSHTEPEDAVQEWAEDFPRDEDVPDSVMVQGYNPIVLDASNPAFSYMFDRLFESLDEELDPEGNMLNEKNEEIIKAFNSFKSAVVKHYKVWSCEEDGKPFLVQVDREYL